MAACDPIPIFVPRLPRSQALLPYLQLIDCNARYTNRGPLVRLLESRMATLLRLPTTSIATAASGTTALQAAILAAAGRASPDRDRALVPAYTFVATAHAAQACGYQISFADVSLASWAMDPGMLLDRLDYLDGVGVVIPVAPYGAVLDHTAWVAFQDRTNIPVVIDAAASFEAIERNPCCVTAKIPLTLSLHATKSLTTGEGGAVLWRDEDGMKRVVEALGFGLSEDQDRSVRGPGLNGRMSEYHAAVGLACLDAVDQIAVERSRTHDAYSLAADRVGMEVSRLLRWPDVASHYCLFEAPSLETAEQAIDAFIDARVAVRRWYGRGLHREIFFATEQQRDSLPQAESLSDRILGLPIYSGMRVDQMERVLKILCEAVRSSGPSPRS